VKTIVVGAGGGGIASAVLAALRGDQVTLLEAHENLGGCASWFKRGEYVFDVGATTVSGLGPNEPLGKLFALLGELPELTRVNPGIVFHLSNGHKLHYYQDFEKWMRELERVFPDLNHRPFWKKVYKLNAHAWGLLDVVDSFPFRKWEDLSSVLKAPQYFHLYPYLLLSMEIMLKRYQLDHPEYLELINGILLISAQTESADAPFLVGAMALAYPQATYAPKGGMKGLMDFFERKLKQLGVTILKDSLVSSIENKTITLKNGDVFKSDEMILNLSYWDLPKLFKNQEREALNLEMSENKTAWGAFTLYFAAPSKVYELYQQVHLNLPDVKNYFVSFSEPDESEFQRVTISTHVMAEEWEQMDKAVYRMRKLHLQNLILDDFKKRFGIVNLKFVTSGTPKTFKRYTHRTSGFVGGLPFLYGMNPWKLQGHSTPLKYVHRVGDTTFPGQGLVGVVAGAFALDKQLKKELSR
jgi:phytoene dehydrogenase-like protein